MCPWVKGEIMYFLVNASPPNWLDVATSNLQVLWLDKKWVFAMVYCPILLT